MQKLKRILVVIVIVISILVLVASLMGIFGVWRIRPQLTADLMALATGAETRVTNMISGLNQIETALAGAQEQVTSVEEDLQTFGSNVEENRPLATAISDRLDLGLLPLIESTRDLLTNILDGVDTLNSSIETLNAIPFVSIPMAELEKIENLSQMMDNLQTQAQDLRTTLDQRRSEIIQGTVAVLTTPTSQLISTLDEMQTRVSNYSQRLGALQARLFDFQISIGGWLTWVAVLVTLILLWAAFSQVLLLVLSWRYFSGQEPLVQQLLGTSAEVEQVSNVLNDAD